MSRYSTLKKIILFLILQSVTSFGITQETKIDSSEVEINSSESGSMFDIFDGKPGKAALYSLMLPGAGQAYNRRYWKIPLALGLEGFFIYRIIDNKKQFNSLDKKWRGFLDDPVGTALLCSDSQYTSAAQVKTDRDNVRQDLEYAWVFWGLSHLVVTLEAFVDRHLIDFDIDDDLSINIKPESYIASPLVSGSFPAISIKYTLD